MNNSIYNLITYCVNDASGSNDKEYVGINSFQASEIIDGYVKIDCSKIVEEVFDKVEYIDSNREQLIDILNNMEIAEVFDATLFSEDNEQIIGAITISRTR